MSYYTLSSKFKTLVVAIILLFSSLSYASEAPFSVSGAKTIDVGEAKYLYDNGALFLDVRSEDEWAIGHVTGAIHLDLASGFEALFSASDDEKGTPVVIYCNSPESLRAAFASAVSVQWGFTNVFFFRGGYFSWMTSDYPTYMGYSESVKASFDSARAIKTVN